MVVAPQLRALRSVVAAEDVAYELVSHVLPLNDVLYIIYYFLNLHNDADMRY